MAEKKKKRVFTNNALRTVIFLCVIIVTVLICNYIFDFADAERSDKIMNRFYALGDNTVDCIYFGSSATQRGFVVPEAYHKEGVAAYSMASGSQPFILTRYLMEEAQKTQNPKLFIVELRGICKTPEDMWDVAVRRMLDNMKPSINKVHAVRAILEYSDGVDNGVDKTGLSYYFPLLKYHSRWNPSKQPHYGGVDYYNGYALEPTTVFKVRKIPYLDYNKKTVPIAEETEQVLNDLLDYCDGIDAKVVFVVSPYEASEAGMGKINYAKNIVEKHGYECLNFLPEEKREKIGLNDKTSYYNREHLNLYGSMLYTDYLSKYIRNHYDIPDRRGDGRHKQWDREYGRLVNNLDGIYSNQYNRMLKKIEKTESGVEQ